GVSPYMYNTSNELTSTPTTSYTYDNNGNTKTKSDGTQYNWDFENRLASVVLPGAGGTVSFKYDGFGRRVQKSFVQGATTTTTDYLYDGANLLEEVDQNGNVLARYTQGAGVDEPLTELRSGTTSYYEQDGLNSVTSLSNSAGALANTYTYDSFGKLTAVTGAVTNPIRYTGREFDSETGVYYYRFRYFDQNIGRFLSEDPAVFRGRDVNLYRYVRNHPTDFIDPGGLMTIDPNFRPDCLPSLERALNILRRLPKKCDCAFRKIGTHRSVADLAQDPRITIHSEQNDAATSSGDVEGGYTVPGDTTDIWLRPVTCRFGRWALARALVHELTHLTLGPGPGQEDQAGTMEMECGFPPMLLPSSITVTASPE
ncbi:MAG: RHS repeat-associated core domain-containing protein, partial [Acidobacteriia bacterium]|nr:RHS repeat-associated core domain-containing protein [Terriglobia bacterium]